MLLKRVRYVKNKVYSDNVLTDLTVKCYNMTMENNLTANVTIPSATEMSEILDYMSQRGLGSPKLTDYAVANGAVCNSYVNGSNVNNWDAFQHDYMSLEEVLSEGNAKVFNGGSVWTRTATTVTRGIEHNGNRENLIATVAFGQDKAISKQSEIDDLGKGVMPRFQNPEALGIDLFELDDAHATSVITINGKVAFWPQSHAETQKPKGDSAMQFTGSAGQKHDCYNRGNFVQVKSSDALGRKKIFSDGVQCTDGQESWFKNKAIRAMRCADGSIQCLDPLMAAQFDPERAKLLDLPTGPDIDLDINQFALGQYLNGAFLQNLQQSTELLNIKRNKVTDQEMSR